MLLRQGHGGGQLLRAVVVEQREQTRGVGREPARKPRPGETLRSLPKGDATWEAELCYHGEYGVEAQLLRLGELVIGRRFETRALAVQWAEEERKAIEVCS